MTDREKVIADIEEQIAWIRDNDFHKFPGWGHAVLAMKDALALLKEQNTVEHALDILREHGWKETEDVPYANEQERHPVIVLPTLRKEGEVMEDREKVVKGLKTCRTRVHCKECPYAYDKRADDSYCEAVLHNDVLELLKEQEDEKKRIMKAIWDTLHEGLSIDTIPDQDWVYERIRHRIEDT